MKRLFFYRFNCFPAFSGNADAFLLPFSLRFRFFGQCRGFSFTVLIAFPLFRAKQRLFFYRFDFIPAFSGNAEAFLLPFGLLSRFFGQSRGFPFTVFASILHFRAMQRLSFYRLGFLSAFSGNADTLLLPFGLRFRFFGQCRRSPFTVFASILHFRAMQRLWSASLHQIKAAISISSNLLTEKMFSLGQANREYRGRDGFLCLWNGLIG